MTLKRRARRKSRKIRRYLAERNIAPSTLLVSTASKMKTKMSMSTTVKSSTNQEPQVTDGCPWH